MTEETDAPPTTTTILTPAPPTPNLTLRIVGLLPVAYAAYLVYVWAFGIGSLPSIPDFQRMFKEMDVPCPWPTRTLFSFFNEGGVWICAAGLGTASVLYWKFFSRHYAGLICFDTIVLFCCHVVYFFVLQALYQPQFSLLMKLGESFPSP